MKPVLRSVRDAARALRRAEAIVWFASPLRRVGAIAMIAAAFVRAAAFAWIAAALLHGCAPSRDVSVAGGAGDTRLSSEGLEGELAAIGGASAARLAEGIRVTLDSDTLFGTDSAMLRLESVPAIEAIAKTLLRYPPRRIAVAAHTDSAGAGEYKMTMTDRQAYSIGELLADMGVPPSRIETSGKGCLEPAAPNATPEGRRANRRVTIDVLPETQTRKK